MTDREALQRIMQVLGPSVPPSAPEGLDWEVGETLAILRGQGIEYKSRSVERREALQQKRPNVDV